MAVPSLLISPHESRSRTALVEPTVSGSNADVLSDGWRLVRGIGNASLLLSPDESRDANGPVEPDIMGDTSVTDGQYGQAWLLNEDGGIRYTDPSIRSITQGSVVVRYRLDAVDDVGTPYIVNPGGLSGGSPQAYYTLWASAGNWRFRDNTTSVRIGTLTPMHTETGYYTALIGWDADMSYYDYGEGGGYRTIERAEHDGTWLSDNWHVGRWASGGILPGAIESYVEYPYAISESEYEHIVTMPRAWEWGPDGHVSAPLDTPPVSVMVRTPQGVEYVTMQDGTGSFGSAGTLAYEDGTLTVGTTGETEVLELLAYNDELSDSHIQRLSAQERWTWQSVLPQAGGVRRTVPDEPVAVHRDAPPTPIAINRRVPE